MKKMFLLIIFLLWVLPATEVLAGTGFGSRLSLAGYPGGEESAEFDLGVEIYGYLTPLYTSASIGVATGWNPWESQEYLSFSLSFMQPLAKWFALGTSGFLSWSIKEDSVNPGVVGVIDFMFLDGFDIAILAGTIWSPDLGAALGIQFGYSLSLIEPEE